MKIRPVYCVLLALAPFTVAGCSQNSMVSSASSSSSAPSPSQDVEDWLVRAAEVVRLSNDPEDVWDCEYRSALTVPDGWDGRLALGAVDEDTVWEIKLATARAGGNFVLLYPGPMPEAEAYLCTE